MSAFLEHRVDILGKDSQLLHLLLQHCLAFLEQLTLTFHSLDVFIDAFSQLIEITVAVAENFSGILLKRPVFSQQSFDSANLIVNVQKICLIFAE